MRVPLAVQRVTDLYSTYIADCAEPGRNVHVAIKYVNTYIIKLRYKWNFYFKLGSFVCASEPKLLKFDNPYDHNFICVELK